eukprot:CAMPEP_0176176276 /NCGR_PEP_ID=MMETSP0120_2-20121206/90295_1 /TAXON_ID=160619 /ORGANISM="Kryptoperidinium foliaceum, Strain CCMP 1326" /LENGTH=361 /DNA_ID=CAMNT_0017514323 /DNA_START=80 /DNA_END=1162 /DNA_ORIENTATION=+
MNIRAKRLRKSEQAMAWTQPRFWRSAPCRVLAIGSSCVEVSPRRACTGLAWSGTEAELREINGALYFEHASSPVCPGSHWCAEEGQECACFGDVVFAPLLFNGARYLLSSQDRKRFSLKSRGTTRCGFDQYGQPYESSDDWSRPSGHCWCTPEEVLQLVKRHGTSLGELGERSNRAQEAFEGIGRPGSGAPLYRGSLAGLNTSLLDVDLRASAEGEEEEDMKGQTTHDSRRRRTYAYTPWALVEVPSQDSAGGGTVTCAYEHGAPGATFGVHTTSGPDTTFWSWGGNEAEEVNKEWVGKLDHSRTTQCYVRIAGDAGRDTCEVGMQPLEELQAHADHALLIANVTLTSLIVITVLVWVGLA